MLLRALLLFVVASLGSVPSYASKFEAFGISLGDRLTEEFAYSHCPARLKGSADRDCGKIVPLSDRRRHNFYVGISFLNWTAHRISLTFDSEYFNQIANVVETKLGKPADQVLTQPIETRLGAEYTNIVLTWSTDDGPFVLQQYCGNVRSGCGSVSSKEFEALKREKDQDSAASAADRF